MDRLAMYRGSTDGGPMKVKRGPGLMLIASEENPLPRWLAPVQMVAAALWHGIKAVW